MGRETKTIGTTQVKAYKNKQQLHHKAILTVLFSLLISITSWTTPVHAELLMWNATVTTVNDGDTFEVTWDSLYTPPEGHELPNRIRIAGVDTNETIDNECLADKAKTRLSSLLPPGTRVRLEAQDIESSTEGRPLRHVFINDSTNLNVATQLVSEGLGLAASYDMEPDYRSEYFDASEAAQIDQVGLWEPGICGGNPSSDIELIVNYDAAGNDANNLNDEYIQIHNNGSSSIDLSGWSIRSSARLNDTTMTIPNGASVDAGGTFRIHIGSGTDGLNSAMYLGLTEPWLDNSGDVVYLRDQYLNNVATQLWPCTLTCGEKQSIVIDDVQYNAPGDDSNNPNGEWIKIRNAGAETVDLTDWRLKDDGFDYQFNDEETLTPGEQLTIYIGSGSDSGSDRYWNLSSGILNNGGQTLEIWTPHSLSVDCFSWGTSSCSSEDPRGAIHLSANFNAAGDDTLNPNGEWIALWNTSSSTINISGYQLKSGNYTYTFPINTYLTANRNIRVFIANGTNTTTRKYWGLSNAILRNSGDYVELIDKNTNTLLRHEWPCSISCGTDYGLVIDAINYDAPGNDATNPNGEWLRIRNSSSATQNLRNWKIVIGPYQLVSVASRPINSGETITIYMGSGTNTTNTMFWGKTKGIMTNSGSRSVKLLSPSRDEIQCHSWGSATCTTQSVTAAIDMSINYDAIGVDSNNPNGEWVNLLNTSSTEVSLDGYHLYTDGTSYNLNNTIQPGERLRVYAGTAGLNAFSNSTDEIDLRPNGSSIAGDRFSYPCGSNCPPRGEFEITAVNYDAEGYDSENPNGEWIEIKNTGTKSADLRDWRVRYKTATYYDFSQDDSTIVPSGRTIKLYMGSGIDSQTEVYWGNDGGILSNSSGNITLQSNYREEVNTFSW